ncbi:zinc finger domain-containing protein [Dothistroma septosporum NZE10]|uniref:Zinc finger domain-containing protein n=1 Tax=Dothistroma septosporum (strain NZE10 / CBS 128990) TaxID=675120 RepID=N1PV64_DOTSN|nr:zinc finger domain-containing protein [Dothistroma septosporum NZE10]
MFKCADCDKVYKTRTSLTRHAHNHASSPGSHACQTCGVVFARRDILNRHINNGHCSASTAGRARTHTACEACRAARIKCDGQDPCRPCLGARKECKYPATTGRISHATRPHKAVHAVENVMLEEHGRDVALVSTPGDGNLASPPGTTPATSWEPTSAMEYAETELESSSAPDIDNTAWPWLHEKNFMPHNGRPGKQSNGYRKQHAPSAGDAANRAAPASETSPASSFAASSSLKDPLTPLSNVVENLVAYAAGSALTPDDRSTRRRYWESISLQLADIFGATNQNSSSDSRRTLYELVEIYLTKFNVLWPTLNHEQLDPYTHHPVLFLTVTSIGAMFGHSLQRQYGTLMHRRLRRLLAASLYDLEGTDNQMVWLAQARLLTQVASMYFGQHQGFSYSQHLAAITVAQLRRMDFMREPIPNHYVRISSASSEEELARYQMFETRRRIAFGIFRTDIFTSVLLSTRPIMTSEEVKLTFPRPDRLWLNADNLAREDLLQAYRTEDARTLQIPFSDIVRIFYERQETKPNLGPVGYELALFGMQESVWTFSQDPELFPRLTGECLADSEMNVASGLLANRQNNGNNIPGSTGFWSRRMYDLHTDRARLVQALEAWSQEVQQAIAIGAYTNHRDTLMSSMLLYRLSKLRLCTPLENLHHISYRADQPRIVDTHVHQKVENWTKSKFAQDAAQEAWDVKMMIELELQKSAEDRARFNFLAFCSLHHAAVVLWTIAGCEEHRSEASAYNISNLAINDFLQDCANLFRELSPLGGNSFEAAAHRLHIYRFPRLHRSAG